MANEVHDAKITSIWTGAFFFWALNGFKRKYADQLDIRFTNRNKWVGYFIQIIGFASVIYFFRIRN